MKNFSFRPYRRYPAARYTKTDGRGGVHCRVAHFRNSGVHLTSHEAPIHYHIYPSRSDKPIWSVPCNVCCMSVPTCCVCIMTNSFGPHLGRLRVVHLRRALISCTRIWRSRRRLPTQVFIFHVSYSVPGGFDVPAPRYELILE